MKLINLEGRRFGRLLVLSRSDDVAGRTMWVCQCDCGNRVVVQSKNLRSGNTRSCGCLLQETRSRNGKMKSTHGMSYTRLYEVWHGMKARCYRPTHPHYQNYGGRGICVCPEWLNSFETFAEWAISHGYQEHAQKGACTLDRIDPDGNYEPSNCRFADLYVQQNNRRDNRAKAQFEQGADGVFHLAQNAVVK